MTGFEGKTYWIVGASEGLGRALAQGLSECGAHLVLSARNADRLTEICATLPNARAVPFDVTDLEAVRRARRFAKAPDGLSAASYSFTLSLTFKP